MDDAINDFFSTTIEKVVKKEYRLNIASFFYTGDIKDHARKYPIDLFVISDKTLLFQGRTIEKFPL